MSNRIQIKEEEKLEKDCKEQDKCQTKIQKKQKKNRKETKKIQEDMTTKITLSELDLRNQKKKCKFCNFQRKCHINIEECNARNSLNCQKCGHFPKSLNCSKSRREKYNIRKKDKISQHDCETLRNFLKRTHYHIRNEKLPYESLLNKSDAKIYSTGFSHVIDLSKYISMIKRKIA